MITRHMLATDPRTPGTVLRDLGAGRALPAATALALATHPLLPVGAVPQFPDGSTAELAAVLAHPDLPAHLRTAYLTDPARRTAVLNLICDYDCLTTAEIQRCADAESDGTYMEYGQNPRTPPALIALAIAERGRTPDQLPQDDPATRTVTELTHDLRTGGLQAMDAAAAAPALRARHHRRRAAPPHRHPRPTNFTGTLRELLTSATTIAAMPAPLASPAHSAGGARAQG